MKRLALVYSDAQADDSVEVLRKDPTTPLQRWRVRQLYADLLTLFREHNCQFLIDLGDTTDTRANISWPVLAEVSAGLWAIHPDPLLSFKLIGNHEQVYRHAAESSASFYWRHHYVAVSPSVVDLGADKPVVVLAPYPADHDELEQWLITTARQLSGRTTLLLGHFQVLGCRLPSGPSGTGIAAAAIKPFTLGLLGHVHRPQQLVGTNCHYVGSPFQQNFGEANETKRVALLDLDTLALTWLALPSRYPTYRQVSVDEFEGIADDLADDQIEVTLKDSAQAERFYAHPLAGQVKTSLLHFESKKETVQTESTASLSKECLVQAYAQKYPVQGFTHKELVEAGLALCQ